MEYLVNVVPSGEVIDLSLLPPNLISSGKISERESSQPVTANAVKDEEGGRRWKRWKGR